MGTGKDQVKLEVEQYQKNDAANENGLSGSQERNAVLDVLNGGTIDAYTKMVSNTRKKEFETYTLCFDVKGLCDQMHRAAKAHSVSIQYSLKQYLQHGIGEVSAGGPPSLLAISPPQLSLLHNLVMTESSDQVSKIHNANMGRCRPQKRKRSVGERLSKNKKKEKIQS
ncbi:hypothetical protein BWQ96_07740 [Gracilariopsis chorda]|uniref:Uncharacterized protein n=1 Tax=Gracilariopsis chorda TaxID=448386 RepID=A0A2V3IKF3_9FLOR|nr:hypothetical protein BWQ96_07740 [Gracilariopsis chorda]|eukprot:PXF42523.1 hypothetical protein BWQ96_07740 [Gracilariopsis chorda]